MKTFYSILFFLAISTLAWGQFTITKGNVFNTNVGGSIPAGIYAHLVVAQQSDPNTMGVVKSVPVVSAGPGSSFGFYEITTQLYHYPIARVIINNDPGPVNPDPMGNTAVPSNWLTNNSLPVGWLYSGDFATGQNEDGVANGISGSFYHTVALCGDCDTDPDCCLNGGFTTGIITNVNFFITCDNLTAIFLEPILPIPNGQIHRNSMDTPFQIFPVPSQGSVITFSISPANAGTVDASGLVNWDDNYTGQAIILAQVYTECGMQQASYTVNIAPPLIGYPTVSVNSPVCEGQTLQFSINDYENSFGVTILDPNGQPVPNNAITNVSMANAGTYTAQGYHIGADLSYSEPITVTVNPRPLAPTFVTAPLAIANGQQPTQFTAISATPGAIITYSLSPSNAGQIDNNGLFTLNQAYTGTLSIIAIATNTCDAASTTKIYDVYPLFFPAAVTSSTTSICEGDNIILNFSDFHPNPNYTYVLTGPDVNSEINSNSPSLNISANTAGNGVYTLTTYNGPIISATEFGSTAVNILVKAPSINTTTASACDSYTWAHNGQTYTSSGTYTGATVNCVTEKLQLTINPSSEHTTTVTACDSYTWAHNGQTYTSSGTYTGATANCVTEKLQLTISPSSTSTSNVTACNSYTWSVNNQTYTTSGTYTALLGCVSHTLQLTINSAGQITGQALMCKGSSFQFNSSILGGTWSTSNSTIATVSNTGNNKGKVTAINFGNATISYTLNGCTSTFNVVVDDQLAPQISCPTNIVKSAGNNCTAKISVPAPTVTDNCGTPTLSYVMSGATNASGSGAVGNKTFATGITTVTYSAIDAKGNTSTCSFTVKITNPSCPGGRQSAIAEEVSQSSSLDLSIANNPSYEFFEITALSNSDSEITFQISNMQGKVMLHSKAKANNTVKLGSDLKPGIYIIAAQQGNNTSRAKIIKK